MLDQSTGPSRGAPALQHLCVVCGRAQLSQRSQGAPQALLRAPVRSLSELLP